MKKVGKKERKRSKGRGEKRRGKGEQREEERREIWGAYTHLGINYDIVPSGFFVCLFV